LLIFKLKDLPLKSAIDKRWIYPIENNKINTFVGRPRKSRLNLKKKRIKKFRS